MYAHYILSITSPDKPGVVEKIASTIESCEGNWLESRLAHLAGKFVGVVRVGIDEKNASNLQEKLTTLSSSGITISAEQSGDDSPATRKTQSFSVVGPDRLGIIKEISKALARQDINVEELETHLSSMPYSGDPIFEANGQLSMPAGFDASALEERLEAIANDLGVDIQLDNESQ